MPIKVEIDHLCKKFGALTAVDELSFTVQQGEVLGFLGPNGAGKSTTMKMITGFLTPTKGTVRIGDYDIRKQPVKAKRCLGYLPEGAPAYPDMTAASFLNFIADIRGLQGAEKMRRMAAVIEKVHLAQVLEQPIETLSKGFKRRVGLAQAILHDPQVLILDEPTDGLDPNQKREVRTLIQEMAKEKVIILSTHILEEVDAVCSRAIIIADGRILADGTPAELESRSRLHNSVTLAVRSRSANDIIGALKGLGGVASVETLKQDDALLQLRVFPLKGQSVVAEIGHHARSANWEVEELHVERGRLDEVFHDITVTDEAQLS